MDFGVGIVTGIANKTLLECFLEQDREIYGTWSYVHFKVVVSQCFKHFLFSPLPGEMIQFDEHARLVQPPTRFVFTCLFWVYPHFPLAGKEQTIYTCPCWDSRLNLGPPRASLFVLRHPTQNTENIHTHRKRHQHKSRNRKPTKTHTYTIGLTVHQFLWCFPCFCFLSFGKVPFTLHHRIRPWNVGQAAKVPWRCFAVKFRWEVPWRINFGWLMGLIGWCRGWLCWLVDWLIGWIIGWLIGWLIGCPRKS